MEIANEFRERAKTRVRELTHIRKKQEDELRQRNLEDAVVFARSAETKSLREEFEAASADYNEAFQIAERWDAHAAWRYKFLQGASLAPYLNIAEDVKILERSLIVLDQALALARRIGDDEAIGITQSWRGLRLANSVGRDRAGRQREATSALQEAIAKRPSASHLERADMLWELGRLQNWQGLRLYNSRLVADSLSSYEAARDAYAAGGNQERASEAETRVNSIKGELNYDFGQFQLNGNDANSLQLSDSEEIEEARKRLEGYLLKSRQSLGGLQRSRTPAEWAMAQHRLGKSLRVETQSGY